MKVAIIGINGLSQNVATRLTQEGMTVQTIQSDPQTLARELTAQNYELFLALTDNDETNLVSCALVKQLGAKKTIATLNKASYLFQNEVDLQRAFHIDYLVFPDLLVVDRIAEMIFEEGIYSKSFLHGNVLLRTVKVTEDSPFAGKTLSEIRDNYKQLLICLIHRPRRIISSSPDKSQHIVGREAELIFAHGKDLLLPDDEITMLGDAETVLACSKLLVDHKKTIHAACILGSDLVSLALAKRLRQHGLWVRSEERTVNVEELDVSDVFVACSQDEEHNLVLALRAKDRGLSKVIALLSDKNNREEADKYGILHVSPALDSASDRFVELIQGGKITSIMSLYDARAEIVQVTVSTESPIVGIPLTVLGPTLPKEILIGVIYTRGRIFIAGGAHILKPRDECLVVVDPKHRPLLEKIF